VSPETDAKGRPVVVFSVRQWPQDDQDWLRMVIDALEVRVACYVLLWDVFGYIYIYVDMASQNSNRGKQVFSGPQGYD